MAQRDFFISYRRATDGDSADTLVGELARLGGSEAIFFDRDPQSLPAGISWPYEIISNVASCETLLAIIGPGWLEEFRRRNRSPEGGWRPDTESKDWVRREIVFALQFGKRVVALLVNGAEMPGESDLPEDMRELAFRQSFRFAPDCDWASEVGDLVEQLRAPVSRPVAVPIPPLGRPAQTPDELPDSLDHPTGKRWDPRSETEDPHSYDYKFCVLDPEVRHRIRVELLAANQSGELRRGFSLTELRAFGEPRKFRTASAKCGLFVQAACIVSDGLDDGVVSKVLLYLRDEYQIHDPERIDPRNIDGESCLVATCLSAFSLHAGSGHLPKALLNDLAEPNPWAIFSRKLLIPDAVIDSKFLGVAFNLSNPQKEYLFLIWHVRTRRCPETMLVPAREEKHYDLPVWQSLDQLAGYDFEKAPIDRRVIEKTFGLNLRTPETKPKAPWLTGFVRFPGFDNTQSNGGRAVRWRRDTVPLDLARMFQQRVSRSPGSIPSSRATDLLSAFETDVRARALAVSVESVTWASVAEPFSAGLKLIVLDEAERPIGTYLILALESVEGAIPTELVRRIRERAEIGFGVAEEPKAVLVLQGIHTADRFEIRGAESLHDPGRTPIHVVRLALGANRIPVKRIAHAIVPVRRAEGPADSLLITRTKGDERPRLPGGKLENDESPLRALIRELNEELALEPDEFEASEALVGEGINVFEISPSSGLLTHYRIFPFLVRVVGTGFAKLLRQIRDPLPDDACSVWPVPFDEWIETGLGFDFSYPRTVCPLMTSEQLFAAALELPPGASPQPRSNGEFEIS